MPQTLAQQVRAKYPGVYDDLSDADLDAKVRTKYPGAYDDLPKSEAAPKAASSASFLDLAVSGVKGVIDGVNPLPILKSLYDDASGEFAKAQTAAAQGDVVGALGHAVAGSPVGGATKLLGRMGKAQIDQFAKAKEAYDQGRYSEALGYTAAGVTPVVGPMAAAAGEEIGTGDPLKAAHGVGLAASVFAPKAVGAVLPKSIKVPGTGKFANRNPAEVAAVQYGERVGIPIDAATATGNPMVRSAQTMADRSLMGAIPAQRAAARQAQALALESGGLQNRAYTYPTSPETAGSSLRGSLAAKVSEQHDIASKAYGELSDLEKAHARPVQVGTKTITREFDDATFDPHADLLRAIAKNGGIGLDKGMPGEIRQLWESRTRGESTLNRMRTAGAAQEAVGHGNAIGGISGVIRRTGGKSLDMMAEALREDGFNIEGPRQLLDAVEEARTARMRPAAQRAGQVDTFEEPITETMGMPVNLKVSRAMLRPAYERLRRQATDLNIPMMGDKAKAYAALDGIMQGPEIQPASVVDAALSDLKSLARFEGMPELRPTGKGIMAHAVQTLEREVQHAVAQAGPEATAARNLGRQATTQKYEVGDLLEQLKDEPVKAYRQATLPQDQGIDYLRQLKAAAPDEMSKIGRAYLSSLFDKATAEGGFSRAQGLQAEWQKLGPETKKALFPDLSLREDLDNFFLLAKKIGENPNPSGTAVSWMPVAQAGTAGSLLFVNPLSAATVVLAPAALGKLLRSRTGIRALTEAIRIPTGRTRAAQALAVSRVASMAGVRATPVPAVAEAERK